MKHLFVSHTIALALKEKGFDENCFFFYNHVNELKKIDDDFVDFKRLEIPHTLAPIYQQAIDWFRKRHGLLITVLPTTFGKFSVVIYNYPNNEVYCSIAPHEEEYYKALDKAIEEAIKLI